MRGSRRFPGRARRRCERSASELGVAPVFKRVDTCAAEFAAPTAYMYSTYEAPFGGAPQDEARPSDRTKVIILGGGPNRIGQGIEFDYCCCHAAFALDEAGFESIMVNCNPETVSTDYDTSDRLYFEPLTAEDVLEIVRVEQSRGKLLGVIVQFGGQTPLKLAARAAGGERADPRHLARHDRPRRGPRPLPEAHQAARPAAAEERHRPLGRRGAARRRAHRLSGGDPPLLRARRPRHGDRARSATELSNATWPSRASVRCPTTRPADQHGADQNPLLFVPDAIEVDVDALADGKDVFVCGVMEHIEEAGIHSGDSACSLPPHSLPAATIAEIERQTVALAKALKVGGLMNVQYAVKDGDIYVLEVNPRASRTVPFVAKTIGMPIAKIAAKVMAGAPLAGFGLQRSRRSAISR